MKRIILCFTAIILLFTNCNNECKNWDCIENPCKIDYPKDVRPIDWENYNDVYTVYWNNFSYCEDAEVIGRTGKQIKVFGWIHNAFGDSEIRLDFFSLINDYSEINAPNGSNTTTVYVGCFDVEESERIKKKFENNTDFSKKCFVQGELLISCLETSGCSKTAVRIVIENADDIYFE